MVMMMLYANGDSKVCYDDDSSIVYVMAIILLL